MNTNDRFAELWTNYLEGDLTDEGLVELRALFASHPELMTAATELYQLHRMLGLMSQEDSSAFVSSTMERVPISSEIFVEQVLSQLEPRSPRLASVKQPTSPTRRVHWRTIAVAVAAMVTTVAIVANLIRRGDPSGELSTTQSVVRFTNTARTKFLGAFAPAIGSPAAMNREYILTSGSVQLQFPTGAEAIVEGPAVFYVLNENRLRMSVGRCSVYCPKGAEGFVVDTPSAQVVDRGTRFAVKVVESAATEVHVVDGVAEVYRPTNTETDNDQQHQPTGDMVRLTQRQARKFDNDPNFTPRPTDFQSRFYHPRLPDRIISYQATQENGGAKDLISVAVQRDGKEVSYPAENLIGVKLIWFKIAEKVIDMRHLAGASELPANRVDLLSDLSLNTGAINPGGSAEPLTISPTFPGVDGSAESDTTPGFAVQFNSPIINGPGPDVVFFELQDLAGTPDGDAFHASPLQFYGDRKATTVKAYDLTLTSPEVQRPSNFYLHEFERPVDSLEELLNGKCQSLAWPQGSAGYRVIAVGIDLTSMGFAEGESADGLFFQDALDDHNHFDPVAIFGLPPLQPQ